MNALRTLSDAGLTLRTDGDRLIVTPASVLTDSLRCLIREHKLELLTALRSTPAPHTDGKAATPAGVREGDSGNPLMTVEQADRCHAGGWDDAEITSFMGRRNRLMRWGYSEQEADDMAERLTLRDREGDARVSCADCGLHRPGRCGNHRLAGLNVADVGRDLAVMLQHCPGFGSKGS